jgi:lysophospholipase L1-like esterase
MKRLYLILFSGILSFTSKAQYDTSFFSTYYEQKYTQFQLIEDKEKGEIIFLGDSITDIADWSDLLKNKKAINRGISGDNTFGLLYRLDEVTRRKPSKIFIMIGINDISKSIPDSIILKNYSTIIQRIKTASPKTKIYIQSVLPTNNEFEEFKRHQNKTEHIEWLNQNLNLLAQKENIVFVNLYPLFLDQSGKLSKIYTNDGLHLKGNAYIEWLQLLKKEKYL